MNKNIVYLNSRNFDQEVINSEKPVLVDFYADWCGPCRMISPIIDQLADEYQGKVKIAKLNVDESGFIANEYGVMGVPTLIFFKNGREVGRLVGARGKGDLARALDRLIS